MKHRLHPNQIQRMPRDQGSYSGDIDGDFGTGTYRALKAYEKG